MNDYQAQLEQRTEGYYIGRLNTGYKFLSFIPCER